jgi:hypothetical protein
MRKSTALAAAVIGGACAAAITAAAVVPAATSTTPSHYTVTKQAASGAGFMAGYVAHGCNASPTCFQGVQATLTVPSLNCASTPTADVEQFVAIGFDNTAIVHESCQSGSPSYQAQYLSSLGTGVLPLTVGPGDNVELIANNTTITVDNLTTGSSAQVAGDTVAGEPSAEVMTAPAADPAVADFAQAGFRDIQVEAGGLSVKKPLGSFKVQEYILTNGAGTPLVKPASLLTGKNTSAFVNVWARAS